MAEIAFGFKCVKPITAEHPIGSGKIVTYEPGDEVPAGDWGRAADSLVENGKIMRYAQNVYAPGEVGGDAPPMGSGGGSAVAHPPHPDWPGTPEHPATVEEDEGAEEDDGDDEPSATQPREGNFPVNHGAGHYELSDGSMVRGKNKALAAQAALDVAQES